MPFFDGVLLSFGFGLRAIEKSVYVFLCHNIFFVSFSDGGLFVSYGFV
jgi:hypothetical protein